MTTHEEAMKYYNLAKKLETVFTVIAFIGFFYALGVVGTSDINKMIIHNDPHPNSWYLLNGLAGLIGFVGGAIGAEFFGRLARGWHKVAVRIKGRCK